MSNFVVVSIFPTYLLFIRGGDPVNRILRTFTGSGPKYFEERYSSDTRVQSAEDRWLDDDVSWDQQELVSVAGEAGVTYRELLRTKSCKTTTAHARPM